MIQADLGRLETTMRRTNLAFALGVAAPLMLVLACSKNDRAGTTTIRSGAPEDIRVTNPAAFEVRVETADRLAGALCRHERECASGRAYRSMEILLAEELVCVTELKPGARLSVDQWQCSPAVARAGFKECLAAIESEGCDTQLNKPSLVLACRPSEICRQGESVSSD